MWRNTRKVISKWMEEVVRWSNNVIMEMDVWWRFSASTYFFFHFLSDTGEERAEKQLIVGIVTSIDLLNYITRRASVSEYTEEKWFDHQENIALTLNVPDTVGLVWSRKSVAERFVRLHKFHVLISYTCVAIIWSVQRPGHQVC